MENSEFSSTNALIPANVQAQLESAQAIVANAQRNPEEVVNTPVVNPAVPLQPAPVVQTQPVVEDAAYWKQRFQVMEGKFKAEIMPVTQLQQEITGLRQMIQTQQVTINSLNTMIASGQNGGPGPAPQVNPSTETQPALDPEKFDHLGPEVVELVTMVSNMAQSQQTQTGTIEALKADKAEGTKRLVWTKLDRDVPQWRAVNEMPEWHQWLQLQDPRSGQQRQALITSQFQSGNAEAVAIFFNDFLHENPSLAVNQVVDVTIPTLEGQLLPADTPIGAEGVINTDVSQVTPEQIRLAAIDYQQGRMTEPQFMELSNKYQLQLKAQMNAL